MISEILNDAINYIESHGWQQSRQGYEKYPHGPCCIMGALYRVTEYEVGGYIGHLSDLSEALIFLSGFSLENITHHYDDDDYICNDANTIEADLASWNDQISTTKAQVIDFLKCALVIAEQRGL